MESPHPNCLTGWGWKIKENIGNKMNDDIRKTKEFWNVNDLNVAKYKRIASKLII